MVGTELHALCSEPFHTKEHYDAILQRLQDHPQEARREDDNGSLSLHLVLRGDPPLEIVVSLVEAYPEAVFEENEKGYLPLHVACRYGVNVDVVRYLIRQNPEAVQRATQGFFTWSLPQMTHYLMSGGKGATCQDLIKALPEDHPNQIGLLELIESYEN